MVSVYYTDYLNITWWRMPFSVNQRRCKHCWAVSASQLVVNFTTKSFFLSQTHRLSIDSDPCLKSASNASIPVHVKRHSAISEMCAWSIEPNCQNVQDIPRGWEVPSPRLLGKVCLIASLLHTAARPLSKSHDSVAKQDSEINRNCMYNFSDWHTRQEREWGS